MEDKKWQVRKNKFCNLRWLTINTGGILICKCMYLVLWWEYFLNFKQPSKNKKPRILIYVHWVNGLNKSTSNIASRVICETGVEGK